MKVSYYEFCMANAICSGQGFFLDSDEEGHLGIGSWWWFALTWGELLQWWNEPDWGDVRI